MIRMRRWLNSRRKVVWTEPQLPEFVKINPGSPPGAAEGLQPGDITMAAVAEEFLEAEEGEPTLRIYANGCPDRSARAGLACARTPVRRAWRE